MVLPEFEGAGIAKLEVDFERSLMGDGLAEGGVLFVLLPCLLAFPLGLLVQVHLCLLCLALMLGS